MSSYSASHSETFTYVRVPQEVVNWLLRHSGELIKAIRAENPSVLIQCNTSVNQLTFMGSEADRSRSMRLMYEKLKRRDCRFYV